MCFERRVLGCSIALTPLAFLPRLGSQVLVNMYNVQPFLEDCVFEPWEKRKEVRRPSPAVRWVTLA